MTHPALCPALVPKRQQAEAAQPEKDEIPSLVMASVWEELSPEERQGIANWANVPQGQMALTKISTLLKAIYYKQYYGQLHAYTGQTATSAYSYVSNHTYSQPISYYGNYIVGSGENIGYGGGGGAHSTISFPATLTPASITTDTTAATPGATPSYTGLLSKLFGF